MYCKIGVVSVGPQDTHEYDGDWWIRHRLDSPNKLANYNFNPPLMFHDHSRQSSAFSSNPLEATAPAFMPS
jgi:hypothetical protein